MRARVADARGVQLGGHIGLYANLGRREVNITTCTRSPLVVEIARSTNMKDQVETLVTKRMKTGDEPHRMIHGVPVQTYTALISKSATKLLARLELTYLDNHARRC